MSESMKALAAKLVTLEGWKWEEGMRVTHPEHESPLRMVEVVSFGDGRFCAEVVNLNRPTGGNNVDSVPESTIWDCLPDLTDPATVAIIENSILETFGGDALFLTCDSQPHMSGGSRFYWRLIEYTRGRAYRSPETGQRLEGEFVEKHETARTRMLVEALLMVGGVR